MIDLIARPLDHIDIKDYRRGADRDNVRIEPSMEVTLWFLVESIELVLLG